MTIACVNVSSTIGPKIKPITNGAGEKPFLIIKKPIIPDNNITQTSKNDELKEYDPINEKTKTEGHKNFLGMKVT